MKITRNNLSEVMFENEDARLLIEDVVTHTEASLYYYHDYEITVESALSVWNRAIGEEEQGIRRLPFLNRAPRHRECLCG